MGNLILKRNFAFTAMPIVPSNVEAWEKLQAQKDSKSQLKKHLTEDIYNELTGLKGAKDCTLADCINSGVQNAKSGIGVYAAHADCYKTFNALFKPIIRDYHNLGDGPISHPALSFGESAKLPNLDPEGKYVISTRCRTARSFSAIPFNARMTKENYLELEDMVKKASASFEGELRGTYHSLATMDPEFQKQLIADHFLFKDQDPYLEEANAMNFWPTGRGIFLSDSRQFLIWCGEEDHLRIISMQMGADLGQVIARLENALKIISSKFEFAHSDQYGFLTFCPTNLGTTIRCSVHAKLPKLSANMALFEKIADENQIQIRGIHGEHSESDGGVYDLSNKQRLGVTEETVIKSMHNGVSKLIEAEKNL